MIVNSKNLISLTEANQNFSKVIKKVEKEGRVVVLKNNKPKYVLSKIDDNYMALTENERLEIIAKRILNEHKRAFEVLAK